jgi:hypothetical protein
VVRIRHSDAQLLELARAGSAPAFASLLHRHRHRLQRAASRSEDPAGTLEVAGVTAMRALRSERGGPEDGGVSVDPGGWLVGLVATEAARAPAPPQVEPMLPGDWFARLWVDLDRRWPSGRRRPQPPRWATALLAALLLAGGAGTATFVVLTQDQQTEVVGELVATPLEGGGALRAPAEEVEREPEEAPELFGDVELGELPSYDLLGPGAPQPGPPTVGPPAPPRGDDGGTGDGR